jgi:hypothetical protein
MDCSIIHSMCFTARHECTICFDDTTRRDGLKTECCSYWYHNKCLDRWYKDHNNCPSCKTLHRRTFRFSGYDDKDQRLTVYVGHIEWTALQTYNIPYHDITSIDYETVSGRSDVDIKICLSESWGCSVYINIIDPKVAILVYNAILCQWRN